MELGQLLLVRDGQASFGSDDHDLLSPLGWEQGRLLGLSLSGRVQPTVLLRGAMRRHQETAEATCDAAGWSADVVEDSGWDEFDHFAMLDAHPSAFGDRMPSGAEFQGWFDSATDRWTSGEFDGDYDEPWSTFTMRVDAALARAVDLAGPSGTAVVFTSGGPISWVIASALTGAAAADSRTALWGRLNQVVVNSSVSKIASSRDDLFLLSFNEHAHLEGAGLRAPAG